MTIRFTSYGAAMGVTGSCHMIETDQARILLDCGLVQGPPEEEERNRDPFAFDLGNLDAVVLSHGHLDHSGLLPKLQAKGYHGPVHCTASTRDLLKIMLKDAAYLEARDVEWENKRRHRAGRKPIEPLYTFDDVRRVLRRCQGHAYDSEYQVAPGVWVSHRDAGHILGSSHVCLRIQDGEVMRRVVFSGDIGQRNTALMNDPEPPAAADVVIMESTYGDRDHRARNDTIDEFARILERANRDGGNVLIPSFAVGRSQEIVFQLLLLKKEGRLPQRRIFLDSPMAIEVTELYLDHLEELDALDLHELTDGGLNTLDSFLQFVQPTRTSDESMALNRIRDGAIIIAASGMCTGGRIRHHLKHNLWRPQTDVVFVGYQARGSLGRLLVDGAEKVTMWGEEIKVRARIHTLGGYSAHAGRTELLQWAGSIGGDPRFLLVHGEPDSLEALRDGLKVEHGIDARIPRLGQTITL